MAHPVSMLLSLLAVIAADGMESSADPISASSSVASWFYSQEGSWTDRLGLRFRDDCQENTGVGGIFLWIWSWARRQGQQRSGHCESREMRCGAGSKMTGLQVRYGRMEHGDRDLYDFRPRCGESWQPWLGMKFPREGEADRLQVEAGVCTAGASVTGIQVMRGRDEWADTDYFNFRLRCAKSWLEQPLGLAFNGLRETRSATCPSGAAIAGLRVHRGFQDWGDMDTYEVSATPLDAMLPMPCSRCHAPVSRAGHVACLARSFSSSARCPLARQPAVQPTLAAMDRAAEGEGARRASEAAAVAVASVAARLRRNGKGM